MPKNLNLIDELAEGYSIKFVKIDKNGKKKFIDFMEMSQNQKSHKKSIVGKQER
jgi:transposase